MKQLLTLLFSLTMFISIAQVRQAGPEKEWPAAGSRDDECETFDMTDLQSPFLDPNDLVEEILGPGIVYSNVSFVGEDRSAGTFTGGIAAGIGFESGILLSSGRITNAYGPNDVENITRDWNNPGDADLDILAGNDTHDASVLQFDFNPADNDEIFIQFVFGSDEYTEYVGSAFNDVFAFYLNGTNIALVPSTTIPISVNTINPGSNSAYYIDNDPDDDTYCTEMDGFTVVLTVTGPINPNVNNQIKLAIADTEDEILDAFVFIRTAGFSPTENDSDLEIEKEVSPPPYYFGNNITFTITVTNLGPDEATGIEINELLPSGYAFVSYSATKGTYSAGTWDGFDLVLDESAVLTIVATILSSGDYQNIANIEDLEQNDPNSDNDEDSINIEPAIAPSTPLANWAIFVGIGLIVAFMMIRFRRVL